MSVSGCVCATGPGRHEDAEVCGITCMACTGTCGPACVRCAILASLCFAHPQVSQAALVPLPEGGLTGCHLPLATTLVCPSVWTHVCLRTEGARITLRGHSFYCLHTVLRISASYLSVYCCDPGLDSTALCVLFKKNDFNQRLQ